MNDYYYSSQPNFLNTLEYIYKGIGYIIYIQTNELITIKGNDSQSTPTQLSSGWNLIGIPQNTNYQISNLPQEIQIIKDFTSFYESRNNLSTLSELIPGKAYLIYANNECEINWNN